MCVFFFSQINKITLPYLHGRVDCSSHVYRKYFKYMSGLTFVALLRLCMIIPSKLGRIVKIIVSVGIMPSFSLGYKD